MDNTASVASTEVTTPVTDSTSTPVTQSRSLSLDKVVDKTGPVAVGETLSYTVTATNTGNTTQTNVVVTDSLLSTSPKTCATLAPGATCVLSGTYVVQTADADQGTVDNTASVASSEQRSSISASTTTPVRQATGLILVKTGVLSRDGRAINYSFTVRNTGAAALTNVTISDAKVAVQGGPIARLEPGAEDSTTFTANYLVNQDDVDAGYVTNDATVSGTPPTGPPVTATSTVTTNIEQKPAMALVKSGSANADGTITYRFAVKNTSNVMLKNITITDPKVAVKGGPIASLAPGEEDATIFSAVYTVTAADIKAGKVDNQALGNAETTDGSKMTVRSGTKLDNEDVTVVSVSKLIDQVAGKLTDRIVKDLRRTLNMETTRFSSFSQAGADALRLRGSCAGRERQRLHGDLNAEYNPTGMVLNADVSGRQDLSDCGDEVRYAIDADIAAYRNSDSTSAEASVTLLRETFINENTLLGMFAGAYLTQPQLEGKKDMMGAGLHAGLYASHEFDTALMLDGYAAASSGRHAFDYGFQADQTIYAKGNYDYAAGYLGLGLSREVEESRFLVTPRAGVDAAFALPIVQDLDLSQGNIRESSTLSLPDIGHARATLETKFEPMMNISAEPHSAWAVIPSGFCQFDFGHNDKLYCGAGLGLEFSYYDPLRDTELQVKAEGEASPDHYVALLSLRYAWYFDDGQGASEVFVNLDQSGAPTGGYEFSWKF